MSSLSWVTVVWSMIASASLTLAAIYLLVWYRNRSARVHLLFAATAVSLAGFAYCELWLMRAQSIAEISAAAKWAQLPMFFLLVSLTWFVAVYLQAQRLWLAWTGSVMRAIFVLVNFLFVQNINFTQITSLPRVRFLGEPVAVLSGDPNPVMLFGQVGALLLLVFVADTSIATWRRGERRKALLVGGSVEFFLLAGLGTSAAVLWGYLQVPLVFSLLYLGLLAVMGYELSTDVLRASQLVGELQSHQVRLEASNRQISDMFGRLITAQETERTRIARDLHDDVSQRVAGLSIMISRIKRHLVGASDVPDVVPALTSMQESTTALAEQIRLVSHNLHPPMLQHAGLGGALNGFCAEFGKLHGIKVTYEGSADADGIQPDMALALYRIAQEGLRNVAKHAEARHAAVTLTRTPAGVQLSIVDDGKGFDLPAARRTAAGLGLLSIDERARLLGGIVTLDTQPHNGTRLHVQIADRKQ